MAINKNHEFEELNGVKCGIVEKNASKDRADFLKQLLEFNHYEVVVAPSPPPKTAAPVAATTEPGVESPAPTPLPETFTIGVTDYTFNPINAIFGRMLKTKDGHFVTLAFWKQEENTSHDEVPYYEQEK
jgi:hypothetical protein